MSNESDILNVISDMCDPHNEYSSWGLVETIFDLPRSVSGAGNVKTLEAIREFVGPDFEIRGFEKDEYYSWTKPDYWVFRSAHISSMSGEVIVTADDNILQLLIHSAPFSGTISIDELVEHLFVSDDDEIIPYRTSYYKKNWGFCVSKSQFEELSKYSELVVKVDTELRDLPVPYGELVVTGNSKKEVLLSSYICHPSMANNELSGILLIARLMKSIQYLSQRGELPYTIRFVLAPETFGSIAYIAENFDQLIARTIGAVVCSCVGDGRKVSLVKGRKPGDFYASLHLSAKSVARENDLDFQEYSFLERGADERQFASPHVALDVGTLCNTKFGEYPEYHTSADTINIISESAISMSAEIVLRSIVLFGMNIKPMMKSPCEPMFSRYGIYPHTRDYAATKQLVMGLLNFSAYSDGSSSLTQIANICSMTDVEVMNYYEIFKKNGVLDEANLDLRTS